VLYTVLRWIAGYALRWFYRDIEIVGLERLPAEGPVLLASNHPNALIDALVVGHVVPRQVTITAKATLLANPITRAIVRAVGIVPLRRASDEHQARAGASGAAPDAALDASRNAGSFDAIVTALGDGNAVLLFPEGKSHSAPEMAPLKTGLARIAFQAVASGQVARVPIVPVGLTFERKWQPRSSILVIVGEPLVVDASMLAGSAPPDPRPLTDQLDRGLRAVTLNFETAEAQDQVLDVSRPLVAITEDVRPLDASDVPMRKMVDTAARLDVARRALAGVDTALQARVQAFLDRLAGLEDAAHAHRVALADVAIGTSLTDAVRFMGRELLVALFVLPSAVWGRINHWIPLRLARWYARRASRMPEDPAMITIVAGLLLVLVFYAAQAVVVAQLAGGWIAGLYLLSLPGSASCDFWYTDRVRRGRQRARAYRLFRRDPALHEQLVREGAWLRGEAAALGALVVPGEPPGWAPG
jgi:1-acyl-sn-glycerol-3-phosphate acyltransferase